MEDTKRKSNGVSRFFNAIGSVMKDGWNTSGTCGFCCGIRLDRQKHGENMPTPSSCCGVRV